MTVHPLPKMGEGLSRSNNNYSRGCSSNLVIDHTPRYVGRASSTTLYLWLYIGYLLRKTWQKIRLELSRPITQKRVWYEPHNKAEGGLHLVAEVKCAPAILLTHAYHLPKPQSETTSLPTHVTSLGNDTKTGAFLSG